MSDSDIPCLIVAPADEDREASLCLLTRQVFPNYDAAQGYLDNEQSGFPNGRSKGAFIVECYFGTNLRPADPNKYKPREDTKMTKRYCQFDLADFEEFLGVGDNGKPAPNAEWNKNWRFWHLDLQGVYEHVYGMVVAPNVTLRIYSSVDKTTGKAREEGKDAIRCCLVHRDAEGVIKGIGSDAKVLRVQNWRENLRKRINSMLDNMGPMCPKCGSHMKERNGRNKTKFWGCSNYPNCKGTRNINE